MKRQKETKKKGRKNEKNAARAALVRCGCKFSGNYQLLHLLNLAYLTNTPPIFLPSHLPIYLLIYLTTVNMGTLRTNAYPLFIWRSRQSFSISAREIERGREREQCKALSFRSFVRARVHRDVRSPRPPSPQPFHPGHPPCIRFNQNATSVGRAYKCRGRELGRLSRLRSRPQLCRVT